MRLRPPRRYRRSLFASLEASPQLLATAALAWTMTGIIGAIVLWIIQR